jgi:hypothetical protein
MQVTIPVSQPGGFEVAGVPPPLASPQAATATVKSAVARIRFTGETIRDSSA